MKKAQRQDIHAQDPDYILAVIYHDPAMSPNEAEIQNLIQHYRTMDWHIFERRELIRPFDDGYTALKFRK